MSVACIVQARMGSTRLPGKVLADVAGRPLLAVLLHRVARAAIDTLVVATSTAAVDDAVADVARREGAEVVRGPEEDVLARYVLALERFPARTVVRITGDCPLTDPALINTALVARDATGARYVSNTIVRTYPDGLDVEVVDADALRVAADASVDPVEREHVTPFVYRRPERFALRSFRNDEALGHCRWTVDTEADLAFVRRVVDAIGHLDFTWDEVLAYDTPRGEPLLRPAGPEDADLVLALRNDPESVLWSRSGRAVERSQHDEWFAALLDNPASRLWIARDDGEPLGFVRVDVRTGVGTVSIAIDPTRRGRGLGGRVLQELDRALAADAQVHTLVAQVHPENEASLSLFTTAGYTETGRAGDWLILRRSQPPSTEVT